MELCIKTTNGWLEGAARDNMRVWRGISYAKPPVGTLRYKRAQPCEPWEGIREAQTYGNRPIQFVSAGDTKSDLQQSEDCLYLNIWAPEEARNCPVFVYIYGGAFVFGESTDPSYTGEAFPSDGVIFVNFNFRVGPLGYFNLGLFDERFDSNCALSDVLMALHWIKDNIGAFGGDPGNITVCGQSAGAATVYALLASPAAKGLFQKAIAMSGFIHGHSSAEAHRLYIELMLKRMGLNAEKASVLLEKPAEEMRDAVEWMYLKCGSVYPLLLFCGPYVGDDLLPLPIEEALRQGSATGIPVIFGHTRDEMTVFQLADMIPGCRAEIVDFLKWNNALEELSGLEAYYQDLDNPEKICVAMTDAVFVVGAQACLRAQCQHAPAYAYRHDYMTPLAAENGLRSMHSCDTEFALGTHGSRMAAYEQTAPKEEIACMRTRLHKAWVNFARTGDPNGAFPVVWEPVSEDGQGTFLIDIEPKMVSCFRKEVYELWNHIPRYDVPRQSGADTGCKEY